MSQKIPRGWPFESRPRVRRVALALALLAAFASVSRTLALDDAKEHAKKERDERERDDGPAHRPGWPMIGHDPEGLAEEVVALLAARRDWQLAILAGMVGDGPQRRALETVLPPRWERRQCR